MLNNNIDQWDEIYPNRTIIEKDIKSNHAYGIFVDNQLTGYFAINDCQENEYNQINWQYITGKHLVIHRLFIDPEYQGKGLAKKILSFTEKYGRSNKYSSIRLDAFVNNKSALALYEKNMFELRGQVVFRKGTFNCYEKKIHS